MNWKPWIWIAVLLAVTVTFVVRNLRPKPVLVSLAAVERGALAITVEEEGRTRVADRFIVSAPVAGFLHRIPLDVGDAVREGARLTTLVPARPMFIDTRGRAETEARLAAAEAAIRTAEQQVRAAEADASLARTQRARIAKLVASGDLPGEALDRVEAQAAQSEAATAAARHAVEQARNTAEALRVSLRDTANPAPNTNTAAAEAVPVTAPVSGRVLRVLRKSEGVVQAGEPLLEIANPRALEVEVELLSADAVRIAPGTRVEFLRWGGDGALEGRVRLIEPTAFTKISALGVEEQRVRVLIGFTSPQQQWERLGDGYRVEARFYLWEQTNVLKVPATALFPHEGGWAVFVVEDQTARRRPVTLGHRNGLAGEILEGLKEGDQVILHPDTSIHEGVPVTEETPQVH